MKAKDLRDKSVLDLEQTLNDLRRQQFKTRLLKASGETMPTHGIKQIRRDIARVMTVITERTREQQKVGLQHG